MFRYLSKQLAIAIVVAAIVVGTAFLIWRLSIYETPTCFDGIRNQDEVDVDCGGVCEPCTALPQDITLQPVEWVASGDGTIDALLTFKNPNIQWGVRELPYTLLFEDDRGERIGEQRHGTTFLLPLETRAIVEQALPAPAGTIRPRVLLGEPVWVSVPDGVKGDDLLVLDPTFIRLAEGPDIAEVRGIVRNDSPFTYDRVDIHVVVRDQEGKLMGLRRTDMRTLAATERREFRVAWRSGFFLEGEPRVDIDAATNVFENENFVRVHKTKELERFQKIKEEPRR